MLIDAWHGHSLRRVYNKYETSVSYTDLCNIASTACDMYVKESFKEGKNG